MPVFPVKTGTQGTRETGAPRKDKAKQGRAKQNKTKPTLGSPHPERIGAGGRWAYNGKRTADAELKPGATRKASEKVKVSRRRGDGVRVPASRAFEGGVVGGEG